MEHCFFFNSVAGDVREYDQNQLALALRHIAASDGVSLLDHEEPLKVSRVPSNEIMVNSGVMVIQGFVYFLDGPLLIPSPTFIQGEPRTDRVIVRLDRSADTRTIETMIIRGTDNSSAPPELIRQGNLYDMCLAELIHNGTTLTIADTRGNLALCGYIGAQYSNASNITHGTFDCGYFTEAGEVTQHNMNPFSHGNMTLDGNADSPETSGELAAHENDPYAHPNLIVDGNTQ